MRRPWKTGEGYAMFWFMSPQTMDFSLLHDWLKMSYYSHAYVNYRWKSCLHFSVCVIVGHGLKASDYELNISKWYKGFCSFMLFLKTKQSTHDIMYISLPVPIFVHEVQGTTFPWKAIHNSLLLDWQRTALIHTQTAAWDIPNISITFGPLWKC